MGDHVAFQVPPIQVLYDYEFRTVYLYNCNTKQMISQYDLHVTVFSKVYIMCVYLYVLCIFMYHEFSSSAFGKLFITLAIIASRSKMGEKWHCDVALIENDTGSISPRRYARIASSHCENDG